MAVEGQRREKQRSKKADLPKKASTSGNSRRIIIHNVQRRHTPHDPRKNGVRGGVPPKRSGGRKEKNSLGKKNQGGNMV